MNGKPVMRFLEFVVASVIGISSLTAAENEDAKPPKDIKFIDVHVHAHSCTPDGLDVVAEWMKRNSIDRCIVSPLNHKGSRDYNEQDRKTMLANFAKYKGSIDRMCIIDAGELQTVDEAVKTLRQEIADGAVAFGEHYGVGLMFDDPKNLLLYEACEKVGLPVMFHIDQNKNMVEKGMDRVDTVLKRYPKCKLIAHAYWWRQLKDADRQLQQYPNLYADLSGKVVPDLLGNDRKFAREFVIRNQDKLLFGTDEGWWSFKDNPTRYKHYTFFETLDLPNEVRYKIYRGNAEKLFGWKSSQDGPLGMKFARLPKATFYMGWDGDKAAAVKVEIKKDFEIGVYDVTQGQWQAVMGANPSHFSRNGDGKDKVKDIKDDELKQFPVENVSWDEVQQFITKLNAQEKGKGWEYRLPTEAEWEYACRGGATSEEEGSYHFCLDKPTNELASTQANFDGNEPAGKANKGPNLERTTKVGSYPANKLGLYDMHGNVWQWCEDLFNAKGPSRVYRGGSWGNSGMSCRASFRGAVPPTNRGSSLGFRLVRVAIGEPGK